MKILIFPGNYLPNLGGLETHVDEFSKYLSKKENIEVTILSPNTHNAPSQETVHEDVTVLRYPAFELVHNFPVPRFWKKQLYIHLKKLYKEDVDIVMTRTRFFYNSFLGLLFAKLRLKTLPLIHVEHGSSHVTVESKITTFIARLWDETIGRLIFNLSDVNIAISKTVHTFIQKYDTRNTPIITRGVDFQKYEVEKDPWVEKEFSDKKVFLYLGRLVQWKGVQNSIQAFNNLQTQDAVFLVVGDGEDKESLERVAGENIVFTGRVSFERAIKILKAADVYVHSAYPGGGLSNSLLQAMYTNNLVVASPHEGANEVITKKTGIPLQDNTIEELQRGMKKALTYDYKKRVENAKKHIEKQFGWPKKVDEYTDIFKEVIQ